MQTDGRLTSSGACAPLAAPQVVRAPLDAAIVLSYGEGKKRPHAERRPVGCRSRRTEMSLRTAWHGSPKSLQG
jgi:hypothetical protein